MNALYWVALKSIWTKEVHRFARIWIQTLVPPVITMTLYFIIFGNLIGSRIGEMHGFDYMQFIVPGLIMMSAAWCLVLELFWYFPISSVRG